MGSISHLTIITLKSRILRYDAGAIKGGALKFLLIHLPNIIATNQDQMTKYQTRLTIQS